MRHQHPVGCPHAPRDQAAVRQIADAHRHVDALFDEIDEAIVKTQIDLHTTMLGQKRLNQRHEFEAPKAHRRRNPQPAR